MIPSPPERWQNSIALKAREAFIDEMSRHGLVDVIELYEEGNSEKYMSVIFGVMASNAIREENDELRKIFLGLMFMANYLHEAKHSRPGSEMAAKLFWLQLERAHEGSIEHYLNTTWEDLISQ